MIEHCSYCDKEHETGDLKPIEGVPQKECPNIHENAQVQIAHPKMVRIMYDLGMLGDANHVRPSTGEGFYTKSDYPPLRSIDND